MTKTLALTVLVFAACSKSNPYYCEDHPDHNCLIDSAGSDTGSGNCTVVGCATGVCNPANNMCVQCTADQHAACTGTTPVCSVTDTCTACTSHDQCGSQACLGDGSCAAESNVAYVASAAMGGTDNVTCTQAMPCVTVAKGLATGRPIIKLTGTIAETVSISSGNVTFIAAAGAQLTGNTTGTVLSVSGAASVSIYDLDIDNALGSSTGIGIAMPSGTPTVALHRASVTNSASIGIFETVGTLILDRATISNNRGGGLDLRGAFDIQNSFIVENGSPGANFGGVSITSPGTPHRLDFNTIAGNNGNTAVVNGVSCGTVGSPITFSNNIIFANPTSVATDPQVFGLNCNYAYSDIGPTAVAGTGNRTDDPAFLDAAHHDYHLQMMSPVKDLADPAATLAIDIDGNPRPQGAQRDIGADEVMP